MNKKILYLLKAVFLFNFNFNLPVTVAMSKNILILAPGFTRGNRIAEDVIKTG